MATTYGSFPGVRVTVAGGGITAVSIGEEEKLVLFGPASYQNDGDFSTPSDGDSDSVDGNASTEDPTQINARREANTAFGEDSALADGMREALANGANINFLYGVAPQRVNSIAEVQSMASGTLDNFPLYEDDVDNEGNIENIEVTDAEDGNPDTEMDVVLWYDGEPAAPSASDTVAINPLTGEYAADAAPTGDYEFNYKYLDFDSAFTATDVSQVVNEDETGIYTALTDSDAVSSNLDGQVASLRQDYKLVNALSGAEPNDNQVVTTDGEALESNNGNYRRRDARYDTSDYSNANQSVDSDYHFKFAPSRIQDEKRHVLGGVSGLFAGNGISDPIYNDTLTGYSNVEQTFSKSDADNMRDENVIPIRQAGSIRVKDNLSTSTETDWERDFWRRRIADRVILIGKMVGDAIIGQINDADTRSSAERLIQQEMRELVGDRLIRPNTETETNWFVDVYEDSNNPNQVNIDIGFTPYGIVKRVEETVTINT